MRSGLKLGVFALSLALVSIGWGASPAAASADTDWSLNATIIEACSCPMFCQCYFATKPAGHSGHEGHAEEHFCRANNAFRVNTG